MYASLIAIALVAAVPANGTALQSPDNAIAESSNTTDRCGRRGKNGPARCLQQLSQRLAHFCALRRTAIARYGDDFAHTRIPRGEAQSVCASERR